MRLARFTDMAGKPKRIRSPEGPDNGWWWQGFRDGKLLIQKCSDCEELRHPPRPALEDLHAIERLTEAPRTRCEQRAFPPLHHPLTVDENVRGVSLYASVR